MTRMTRFAVTFVVTAGGLLAARGANAQATDAGTPTCASLTNPVYVDGSSAFVPTMERFRREAGELDREQDDGRVHQPRLLRGRERHRDQQGPDRNGVPTSRWHAHRARQELLHASCLRAEGGLAISDVFYGSCGTAAPATQPATLKDFPGPAQAMVFIVPKANTTTQYITAAEANILYGCGATAGISTFNQASGIFCRDPNSGTQVTIAEQHRPAGRRL